MTIIEFCEKQLYDTYEVIDKKPDEETSLEISEVIQFEKININEDIENNKLEINKNADINGDINAVINVDKKRKIQQLIEKLNYATINK